MNKTNKKQKTVALGRMLCMGIGKLSKGKNYVKFSDVSS
jgi:hypothetical protein